MPETNALLRFASAIDNQHRSTLPFLEALTVEPFRKVSKTAICQNEEVYFGQEFLLLRRCALGIPEEEFWLRRAVRRLKGFA